METDDSESALALRDRRDVMQLERINVLLKIALEADDFEGCISLRDTRNQLQVGRRHVHTILA